MTIEDIFEVMTMYDTSSLDGATILSGQNLRDRGIFVWGVRYRESRKNQVELAYEAHKSIYLIKLDNVDGLVGQHSELRGTEDYRLKFFKSCSDYKKFFETLNKWFIEGKIGERDYVIILNKFKFLYRDLPSLSIGEAISTLHGVPNRRSVKLIEAKKILSSYPVVQRICSEAQISLL